jgi:hypothetical protein
VKEICVPDRSAGEERSSKRHGIGNKVSREDIKGSSCRVVEKKVRSPLLMRNVVESEEDEE